MSPHEQLDEAGYVVLPGLLDPRRLAALSECVEERYAIEGEAAGAEFKTEPGCRRLANLMNKGDVFHPLVADPRVLPLVEHVLGPRCKLSSLNARSINARSPARQPLHADMAAVPDASGAWVCNVVWMLDEFRADNGPIRLVPGSHRWGRLPQDALEDPLHYHPLEIWLTGASGTAVVMNAHLWHGGLENQSGAARTAIHAFYCRRDKPQQQYQRGLLDADVQERLSPDLRRLLALDDPLNDELSRSDLPRSGFLK